MQRLAGRIWFDPGVPALSVPYHDTNDFFYSGHLGTITIWMCEYYIQGYKCMTGYCVLLAIFMWVFLTLMRVHYIIDLITGVMVAHWCVVQADWLCFFADVKLFGLPH